MLDLRTGGLFRIRVRACTMRCRCHNNCRRRDSASSEPRCRESNLSTSSAESVARPGDPSSASAPASSEWRPHPRSTTQRSTPPAVVQTSEHAARFHPYTHFEFLRGQISIEGFRALSMLQPQFLRRTRARIDKGNLLEARMVILSYNDHRSAAFSRPRLVGTTKAYSGVGADIVMESISLITPDQPFPRRRLFTPL